MSRRTREQWRYLVALRQKQATAHPGSKRGATHPNPWRNDAPMWARRGKGRIAWKLGVR